MYVQMLDIYQKYKKYRKNMIFSKTSRYFQTLSVNYVFQSLFKWQNISINEVRCIPGYIQTLFTSILLTHTFTYSRFMTQWTQLVIQ